MAIQLQGNGGVVADVGGTTFRGQHVHLKPLEYGALGHYRVNHRFVLVASQAANSRLFEVRNSHATNLIIPTRFVVKWMSISAHTALIEDSLDAVKVTSFTAVDTTNTVTPTASVKRGATMAAAPGSAVIRGITAAGNSAGMTGGTLTEDAGTFAQCPLFLAQAAMATADTLSRQFSLHDILDDVNGTHPFVFSQNEGLILKNRVLLGAAATSVVYIDFSWAEVAAF